MYTGKLVFAQIMDHLPLHTFRRIVARYAGERKVKSFSCLDQFLCMAFAQLTYRESLRDIETCLRAQSSKLYHLGTRSTVARNTLANANAVRDWRMYADFAQSLIAIAKPLYADETFGVDLKNTVYALDTTTIDLCLSVFPWAPFRSTKAAVKMHTLLDLRGNIPTFIHISDSKMHEVNVLDQLIPEPRAFYIMDRGFTDFARLYRLHTGGSFFVIRGKSNLKVRRRYSHPVERDTGLICDQTVMFTGFYALKEFEQPLRRIRFKDPETVFEQYADRFRFVRERTDVVPGVFVLPNIGGEYPRPSGNKVLFLRKDGTYVPDAFRHEIVVALRERDSLVVLTGCSHNGLVNMVETVTREFPGLPIKAVVGGFHLIALPPFNRMSDSEAVVADIGRSVLDLGVGTTYTGHCTGTKAFEVLRHAMGARVQEIHTGSLLEL